MRLLREQYEVEGRSSGLDTVAAEDLAGTGLQLRSGHGIERGEGIGGGEVASFDLTSHSDLQRRAGLAWALTGLPRPKRCPESPIFPARPGPSEWRPGRVDVVLDDHVAAGEAQHTRCCSWGSVVLTSNQPASRQPVLIVVTCGGRRRERERADRRPACRDSSTS